MVAFCRPMIERTILATFHGHSRSSEKARSCLFAETTEGAADEGVGPRGFGCLFVVKGSGKWILGGSLRNLWRNLWRTRLGIMLGSNRPVLERSE